MTFKDLQKLVEREGKEESQAYYQKYSLFQRLRDKPFWTWDSQPHKKEGKVQLGYCCFNYIIGLPRKSGIEKPLFDYERILYKALREPAFLNAHSGSERQEKSTYTKNVDSY